MGWWSCISGRALVWKFNTSVGDKNVWLLIILFLNFKPDFDSVNQYGSALI